MREVELPPGPAPTATRSFAACLAAILDLPVEAVPCPAQGDPFTAWRGWLAARGLGLAPIAGAAAFAWAGFWIARLQDGRAVVMFGTPAGIAWDPVGTGPGPVFDGWAVAALDPGVSTAGAREPGAGTVTAIVLAPAAEAPAHEVQRARARPGAGLEGDRYAQGAGSFSTRGAQGHELTLIEAEALEGIAVPGGGRLTPAQARRNVVTRGVSLNDLVSRRFTVGEVECVGRRLCEPCALLERLTRPGVLRAFVHRGGLRADILTPGEITVGAPVRPLD